MSVSLADFGYALQEYYSKSAVENVALRDHAFLSMIKRVKTSGEVHTFPTVYGLGGGRSASFTNAQGNPSGSKGAKFKVECVNDYAVVQIDTDVLEAADGMDAASFLKAQVVEFDAKLAALGNSLSHGLFRSGSGSIGKVSAAQVASDTTITLANADDALFLEVGMKIVADSVDGGGTVGTTISFVKSVDRDAGTFEASASVGSAALTATASDLTANQYVFPYGDYDAKMTGVAGWIPATVASNDSFFGVNRSADRIRLAGHYLTKTGVPVEEAISDAVEKICKMSQGNPKHVFLPYGKWNELNKSMASKQQFIDVKPSGEAAFMFQGIMLNGPRGPLTVLPDSDIPANEMLVTQLDTWELIFMGNGVPHLQNMDGNQILRTASADAIEARWKARCQLINKAPAFSARVILS